MIEEDHSTKKESFALTETKLDRLVALCKERPFRAVLEFGSGQSTAAFCQHLSDARVVSIDNSLKYMKETEEHCQSIISDGNQLELKHCPLKWQGYSGRLFLSYALGALQSTEPPSTFDLCLIDGPVQNRTLQGREWILYQVFDLLSTGSVIIVDDAHRRDSRIAVENWLTTFGNSLVVTSTENDWVVMEKTAPCEEPGGLGGKGWMRHHSRLPKILLKTIRYPIES